MPAVVDHEQRRERIAALVARMIAAQGLEAVTVRSVAEAAGFSTAVVSHYFADKRDLLLRCYQYTARRAGAATAAANRLHAALDSLLPHHPVARENWLVWVVFWGVAIADPEFSAAQRLQLRDARERVCQLWAADHPSVSSAVLNDTAAQLLTVLMGIAVQAAFDPADWPKARQRRHLSDAIEACTARLKSPALQKALPS